MVPKSVIFCFRFLEAPKFTPSEAFGIGTKVQRSATDRSCTEKLTGLLVS